MISLKVDPAQFLSSPLPSSQPSTLSISCEANDILRKVKRPEQIVKRILIADFQYGICLVDWKRPGCKDGNLEDTGASKLVKTMLQFSTGINGGMMKKIVLEAPDFEDVYLKNSTKSHAPRSRIYRYSTSGGPKEDRKTDSISSQQQFNHSHTNSSNSVDENSSTSSGNRSSGSYMENPDEFCNESKTLYIITAMDTENTVFCSIFIDGKDMWLPLIQYLAFQISSLFASQYSEKVIQWRPDLRKLADGVKMENPSPEELERTIFETFLPFQQQMQFTSKSFFQHLFVE